MNKGEPIPNMNNTTFLKPVARFGLERSQFEAMHTAALQWAEQAGFQVPDERIRKRLAGRPGFRVAGDRIHPAATRIEAFVAAHRARHPEPAPPATGPAVLGTSDRPLFIVDGAGGALRPFTRQDAIDGAKLIEVLRDRGVRGTTTGLPSDVDPLMAPFEQVLIGLRYGRGGAVSSHAYEPWHAGYMEQIARAQGHSFGLTVWLPSPFRLEGNEVDAVLALEGRFDSLSVGSMPLMGITAPMDLAGTWIQALAETLGAATMLSELYPEIPVAFFPHPHPADLITGGYGMGLPEMHLFDVLKSEILPFYGLRPPWGKSSVVGAPVPGAQAQVERTGAYVLGFLHGYREFDMGGILSCGGDVFSPVQLLLDLETLGWAERYARGVEWDPGRWDLERWTRLAQGSGVFGEDPDEVARMREVYWTSRHYRPLTATQHLAAPRDLLADLDAEARRLIASHAYEPDATLLRDVERIVAHARQHPPGRG